MAVRKHFVVKPSITASTAAEMIDAFENKLAELDINSSTSVKCSSESIDRAVEITEADESALYKDVEGGFGEPDAVYSLAEIKEYWNRENMGDPVLRDYSSYDSWWLDTLNNFLKPVYD